MPSNVSTAPSTHSSVGEAPAVSIPAVVVTGGSRGIGLAIARRFADAGHHVVLVARDPNRLAEAAALIAGDRAGRARPVDVISLDVTEAAATSKLQAELEARALYCDILVNNAGIGLAGPFVTHSREEIDRLLTLNIAGLTRLMRHFTPAMVERQRGGVMNIASLGGLVPGPNQAAYYASKAYVISLSQAVASELAASGVRIVVVAPGPVATGFHAAMGAERSLYRMLIPAQSPDTVARSAYRGYRLGRRVVVPGLANTLFSLVLRLAPHTLTVPLVGWLLRKR